MAPEDFPAIRARNVALLKRAGYAPAEWFWTGPRYNNVGLRPLEEIARRLWAMNAVLSYVTLSRSAGTRAIHRSIEADGLRPYLLDHELAMLKPFRWLSHFKHIETVGWLAEHMHPLAWILGLELPLEVDGAMGDERFIGRLTEFIGNFSTPTTRWLAERQGIRTEEQVVEAEDLFFLCHHAVRSAQLGQSTVPRGFDPMVNGMVIQAKRQSLSWAICPSSSWTETTLCDT